MKVWIANESKQQFGGGFSFIANIQKALDVFTNDYSEADIVLIPSASMVKPEVAEQAKADGKSVVLRIDNALRNSRNQNKGMARMKRMAEVADLVVYQSAWSQKYLAPFTGKKGRVILNSVNESIFKPGSPAEPFTYLYSRFNRDETKGWEVARYWYSQRQQFQPGARLTIAGQFSEDLINSNFDFYMDEHYRYIGVQDLETMADVYRQHKYLIYTYFNDACSNTLIEALMSGCHIVGPHYFKTTGGADQIIRRFGTYGREYFSLPRMAKEYMEVFEYVI